jgi:hypothetical protein
MIASNLVTTSLRENVPIKDFCILSAHCLNFEAVKVRKVPQDPLGPPVLRAVYQHGLVKTWEMDGAATKEKIAKFWV